MTDRPTDRASCRGAMAYLKRAMNYEEHVGDVLELNFISSSTKLLWWVVDAVDGTREVSTNRCRLLLTVDAVAVDKGRGACQVLAKLS